MHNFRNEIVHNAHNLLFCNRHNRFDYTMCKPPYSDIRCRNTPGIPHRILNLCNQHKRTLHISNSRHILGSLRKSFHHIRRSKENIHNHRRMFHCIYRKWTCLCNRLHLNKRTKDGLYNCKINLQVKPKEKKKKKLTAIKRITNVTGKHIRLTVQPTRVTRLYLT